MAKATLFQPPTSFENRIEELGRTSELEKTTVRLLMQVELALELMVFLRLDDEPVTAPWTLISGVPIRHPRLQALSDADRRAIANVRQIVPFSAKFSWIGALRAYREIPEEWRNYNLRAENGEELELSERIICNQKDIRQPVHQHIYEECLSASLDYRTRTLKEVNSGDNYEFKAETQDGTVTLAVTFSKKQLSDAQAHSVGWFTEGCATSPVLVTLVDLAAEAEYLDQVEEDSAIRYGWPAEKKAEAIGSVGSTA